MTILLSSSLVVNRSSSPGCQLHLNSRYHANYLEIPTVQKKNTTVFRFLWILSKFGFAGFKGCQVCQPKKLIHFQGTLRGIKARLLKFANSYHMISTARTDLYIYMVWAR
jgi:hypothetical protein